MHLISFHPIHDLIQNYKKELKLTNVSKQKIFSLQEREYKIEKILERETRFNTNFNKGNAFITKKNLLNYFQEFKIFDELLKIVKNDHLSFFEFEELVKDLFSEDDLRKFKKFRERETKVKFFE